jgi:hypothetical protein
MSSAAQQTSVSAVMTGGFPGMLADADRATRIESYVSDETVNTIGFGLMVGQGSTSDNGAILLAAQSAKMVGIVVHSHAYEIDQELSQIALGIGIPGLLPGITLGLLQMGAIWVWVTEAVTPASPVRVHMDTNSSTNPGQFCTTAVAGHTVNISAWARYEQSTTGAGPTVLYINSVANRGQNTSD